VTVHDVIQSGTARSSLHLDEPLQSIEKELYLLLSCTYGVHTLVTTGNDVMPTVQGVPTTTADATIGTESHRITYTLTGVFS